MKHIKYLLVIMLCALMLPIGVFAVDESNARTTTDDNKVNIYFFRGEGCSHCAEAEEFFDGIKEEYGDKYNLVDYEVWYNEDNSTLMQQVADFLGQDVSGVPYIIIGKKTWNGYSADYSEEIKKEIDSQYNTDKADRYDIMDHLTSDEKADTTGSDVLALIIIVIVVAGVVLGIFALRKKAN